VFVLEHCLVTVQEVSHVLKWNPIHVFSGSQIVCLPTTLSNRSDTSAAALQLLKDFKRWGICRF